MDMQLKLDRIACGYQDSVILLTSLRLGVFDALAAAPRTAAALASDLELDARALSVVLHALAANELLVKTGETFALAPEAAPLLASDGADTQARIYRHHDHLLQRWVRLEEVLRSGEPVRNEGKKRRTPEQHRAYICGMEDVSRKSSREAVDAIDLSGARRLLDVGGGPAIAARVFAERHPGLRCTVFDVPETVVIAREMIEASGLADRIDVVEGDFTCDPLPGGYDVVYVSNVIHIYGPETVHELLAKAVEALEPGGLLLVKDFFLEDSRLEPVFATRFSVNMLIGTDGGRSYAFSEVETRFRELGLVGFTRTPVGLHSTIVGARRP